MYIMAVSGVCVDCKITENKEDDLCLYLVDRSIIMRDDLPDAKNGEIFNNGGYYYSYYKKILGKIFTD